MWQWDRLLAGPHGLARPTTNRGSTALCEEKNHSRSPVFTPDGHGPTSYVGVVLPVSQFRLLTSMSRSVIKSPKYVSVSAIHSAGKNGLTNELLARTPA